MKVAVSSEENPASTRRRDRSSKKARTSAHAGALISDPPLSVAGISTSKNSLACAASSSRETRPRDESPTLAVKSAVHFESSSARLFRMIEAKSFFPGMRIIPR